MEKGETERTYLWQGDDLCGIPEEGSYVLTDILHTPYSSLFPSDLRDTKKKKPALKVSGKYTMILNIYFYGGFI